ncbi:hypothetical protein K7I13_07430 [Brucepastera parasyntrophica]|uniref:hypothetical protein n=1 Tax=Brucepastera parasyntrophica TaxID=2880008 RepID=UPI0021097C81|nr:hypothetical protein [Brucepastera parasyntrophica]ULQ61075.1 hypothetical protein K7I13_07430 [Brucepastera parasyntrophica]
MKKIFLLVLILFGPGVFAENNILLLGINGYGVTAVYERAVSEKISIASEIDASMFYGFMTSVLFGTVRGGFYPFAGSFYMDMGIGYGYSAGISLWTHGVLLSPGAGWKIDIGKKGGFILDIGLCSDWIFRLTNDSENQTAGAEPVYHPKIWSPVLGIKVLLGFTF